MKFKRIAFGIVSYIMPYFSVILPNGGTSCEESRDSFKWKSRSRF